jgi:hypothetical protein
MLLSILAFNVIQNSNNLANDQIYDSGFIYSNFIIGNETDEYV